MTTETSFHNESTTNNSYELKRKLEENNNEDNHGQEADIGGTPSKQAKLNQDEDKNNTAPAKGGDSIAQGKNRPAAQDMNINENGPNSLTLDLSMMARGDSMPSAELLQRLIVQQQEQQKAFIKIAAAKYGMHDRGDKEDQQKNDLSGHEEARMNQAQQVPGNSNVPIDIEKKIKREEESSSSPRKKQNTTDYNPDDRKQETSNENATNKVKNQEQDLENLHEGDKSANASKLEEDNPDDDDDGDSSVTKPKPPMINGVIDKQSLLNMKPKRPLSAYNFFFQEERSRLLGVPPCTEEEKKRRKHRKSHGKIAFTELAKHVGQKWKNLDKENKAIYEKKQLEDKKRYQKELSLYDQMIKEIHGMVGNDEEDDGGAALASFKGAAAVTGAGSSKAARAKAASVLQEDRLVAAMGGAAMGSLSKFKGNAGATPNQMAQLLNFQKQQQQQQMQMAQNSFMQDGGYGTGLGGMGGMGSMPGMGSMGGMGGMGGMPGMGPMPGMGGMGAMGTMPGMAGMGPAGMGTGAGMGMGGMAGMSGAPDPATQAALLQQHQGRERYERALLAAVYDKMLREGGNPNQMPHAMMGAGGAGDPNGYMKGMGEGGVSSGSSMGGRANSAGAKSSVNSGSLGGGSGGGGSGGHTGRIGGSTGRGGSSGGGGPVGGMGKSGASVKDMSRGGSSGQGGGNHNFSMGIGGRGTGDSSANFNAQQHELQQQFFMLQQQMQQDQMSSLMGSTGDAEQNGYHQGASSGSYPQQNWGNFY